MSISEARSDRHRLSTVTDSSGFQYPSLYSFPPFFTKQVHSATLASQKSQWTQLILAHCRHHRTYRLDLGEASLSHELWNNKAIDRKLDAVFQREILMSMVESGSAQFDPPLANKSAVPAGAFIFFRRPEEWAELIYSWVTENGLTNSIMTFYELTTGGDLAPATEFYEIPIPMLRQSLAHLAKSGRAQVFKGATDDGDGVKFF